LIVRRLHRRGFKLLKRSTTDRLDLALSPSSHSYTNPSTFSLGTFKLGVCWSGFVPNHYVKVRIPEGAQILKNPLTAILSILRFDSGGEVNALASLSAQASSKDFLV
jgi:hypothetical protein